ncbi:hypothetical protein D3C78_1189490 [compost metagenome]
MAQQFKPILIFQVDGLGIFFQRLKTGHNQGGDKFAGIRDDCHLFDKAVLRQRAFKHLRGNVLAAGGFHQILKTLGDKQISPFIYGTGVAGLQPAICSKGGGGFQRLIEITAHHHRATHLNFTFLANTHLYPRQRLANRAKAEIALFPAGNGGAGLGHAIAIFDVNAHRLEKQNDVVVQFGTGGRQEAHPPTEDAA